MIVLILIGAFLGYVLGGGIGAIIGALTCGILSQFAKLKPSQSKSQSVPLKPPPKLPVVNPTSAPAMKISLEMGNTKRRGNRNTLTWISNNQSIEIAGRLINAGMIYVVDALPEAFEASAINRRLPVGQAAIGDYTQLPYYPCYDYLSPQQRGTYLDWLANDRRDANPQTRQFGYLFLFFYGLERRVLVDGDFSNEIAAEIARLIETYSPHGRSKSLPSYLSQLLHYWGFHQGQERYAEIWPWILKIRHSILDKDELNLVLASLAIQGANAPARVAREIAYHEADAVRSNVTTRSPDEFKALFDERFSSSFPDGLPLKLGQRTVVSRYRPASGTLRFEAENESAHFVARTTYVSIPSAEKKKLVTLWNNCCSDLSGYVRAKARSVGKSIDLRTLIATPVELRAQLVAPIAGAFNELLDSTAVDDEFCFLTAGIAGDFFGLESREKYTLAQSKQLAEGIECLGLKMEPDPRTHGAGLSANKEIVLFAVETDKEPSNSFLGRCALVQMAASVAGSDGGVDIRESETISLMIDSEDLHDSERIRLRAWSALLERNLDNAPATITKVAKAVPDSNSQAVAQLLCRVAIADGVVTKSEERMLQRIFRALRLTPDIIETLKKRELEGFDEVSVSKASPSAPGEVIPSAETKATPRFALDKARIQALSEETAEVISILSVAMADAEHEEESKVTEASPHVSPAEPLAEVDIEWAEGLDSKFLPLLARLVERDSWSRSEFDALASEFHLMARAAYDAINEWADEFLGDFLLEDEDPISVNLDLIPT